MAFLQTLATLEIAHTFVRLFFGFLIVCFFVRMILSWLSMAIPALSPGHPLVRFFDVMTGPLYDPLYKMIPKGNMGAFDMAGIIAFIFAWWGLGVMGALISFALPAGW